MGNTLTLLRSFCIYDFIERNCEKAVSLLSKDICWFGTSDYEDVHSIAEAEQYITHEIETLPSPYKIEINDESYTAIGTSSGIAFFRMMLENDGVQIFIRVTAASRMEDGTEKLCSMHFSISDATQQKDEYFPIANRKEEIARTKHELIASTMAGGLLGGYLQEDFPFYFINEMMLKYLGYVNEADFISDIRGFIINGIHPDDREFVNDAAFRQLATGNQYTVDYRMKKKDNSYIWVHDIGRKTIDETGKEVIISVCYDITREHEKQVQLDNLINALPGGVALYQAVNEDFKVIYHSKGVGAISGRTPEEYETLVKGGIRDSVCSEDADSVFAAFQRAANTDEVVSLDYRIPHAAGGFVWISGSFQRTSIENGSSVIHAVFTEMPQQRELINGLTVDSSTGIIVSDNATHELLYINPAARRLLQIEDMDYLKKKCHQYLMGFNDPCSFCKKCNLGVGKEDESEIYLPKIDKYFISQGRLTRWAGREAHVEYLTDITASKKAQKQLDDLVQNIACGVVVFRINPIARSYEIQYMNEGFCKIFEDTEVNLRARYTADINAWIHPDDLGIVQSMTAHLLEGRAHTDGTLRFILPSKKVKWIRLDVNSISISQGVMTTYATYIDVTTQMQQEQQLHDMVHNVPGGMCLYRWNGHKLEPIVVSKQFSALLGENIGTSVGQIEDTVFAHAHPDDLPDLQKEVQEAFHNNRDFEYTYRSKNYKTGQYLWLYVQGTVVTQEDGTQLAYVSYTDITKEQLTAQKLRASERALDAATEQAGLWYWNYDPMSNRAYFNPRCMRDFDLPQTLENYPQVWLKSDFILADYIPVYYDAAQKVKNGELRVVFEAQVRFKDGITHWMEFMFANLLDENGKQNIIICTGRLIDEQKALLAKYELEKQKSSLEEKNLLIHAVFNINTGKTLDYQYSAALEKTETNYQQMSQSIGMVAQSIVNRAERERFLQLNDTGYLDEQLKQGNQDFSMEYRRKMPSGQIIWVRNIFHLVREPDTGEAILFEYCYDIHQQKMAEEVLYSATVYDYESVASVNFNIGKMMYYGASDDLSDQRLLDYEEVSRDYANHFVLPEKREQFMLDSEPKKVMKAVSECGSYDFITRTLQSDGTVGIIKSRFVPYDTENNICILTRTNVTELLNEEENKNRKLQEALTVARQANSAKTDFLSAMSHDIRTPMNAIVGMCALALEDEHDEEQVHESLENIRSSSQLLLSLINNILDMSRIESGKMVLVNEPFSMKRQINDTAMSYRILAEQKQQNFELDINIIHDACNGDIARIHSAIDNILSNAIKYTPAGGTVTYRVLELLSGKNGIGIYRFEISDTGMGIGKDKMERLFEPFYRGETDMTSAIEGTGLGLPIAKAIIDLKGGTISVKSEEGSGTTFVIELPIHLVNAQEISEEQKSSPKQNIVDLSNRHILLCEDHPVNQRVMQKILERVHARVTIAENGQVGYETFIKGAAGTFDLILMDIQMPQMNGYEATKAIRESDHPQAKTIPIIALSANAFTEDVQKSLRVGMNAHLAKPVEPKTLFEVLGQFLYSEHDSQAAAGQSPCI